MKKILFLPMRSGSKSIIHKNIQLISGKPLFKWFIDEALESNIDEIHVAIDTVFYEYFIRGYFPKNTEKLNIYYRDKENSEDSSTTESVIIEFLSKNNYNKNDLFILGQITNPFIKSEDINNIIDMYNNTDYNSILSVSCLNGRFIWGDDGPLNYDYKNRPLRQNDKNNNLYMENGALYISTVGKIFKYKNRLCPSVGLYKMDYHTHYELDDEYDLEIIESLLKMKRRKG